MAVVALWAPELRCECRNDTPQRNQLRLENSYRWREGLRQREGLRRPAQIEARDDTAASPCADQSSGDSQDRNRTSERGPALLLLEQTFQIMVEPRHTLGVAVLVRSARLRCGLFVFRRGVPLMIGTGVTATLFNEINKVEGSPECR